MRRPSKFLLVFLASMVAVSVAACGSGGSSGASSSTGSPGSSGSSSAAQGSAASAKHLKTAYAGLDAELPTAKVKVTKGVEFWVASCGQMVETCSVPAAAAIAAAKSIGWNTHLCDGQLNPAGVSNCLRQAVAAKAAAIDVVGFDCAGISQAVQAATAAGVKVIGGGGLDCAATGGPQGYSGTVQSVAGITTAQYYARLGKLQADWVIGTTGGKAKVLSVKFLDESWGADIQNAFAKELATCSGCSILNTVDLSNGDVGAGTLRTKFSTALLQAPSANAVNVPVDGWFSSGLAQAVASSGRAKALHVIGAFGLESNMDYIRSGGGEDATAAFSAEQAQWGAVDIAARLLAGQSAPGGLFPEGIGIRVVDAQHNLPPKGSSYRPPLDYKANYAKIWTSS